MPYQRCDIRRPLMPRYHHVTRMTLRDTDGILQMASIDIRKMYR